ncbi:MAG: hypothetical protein ACP5D6_06350 [Kosmotogaceae bacterium]
MKITCPKCGSKDIYSVIDETNGYRIEFYDEESGYEELDFGDKIEFGDIASDGYYCAKCGNRFYTIKELA